MITQKLLTIIFLVLFIMMTISYADALCVKATKVNVRMGPGTIYDIAWEVYKYMPFLKVGVSLEGNWYAVRDVDGDVNWIHKNLVTDTYRCAVVKTEKVNVRKGPGINYSKIFLSPTERYHSFKVLKTKAAWVKVKDEWDNIGWIHRRYLWIQ